MSARLLTQLNTAVRELFRPGLKLTDFPERITRAVQRVAPCDVCTFGALDLNTRELDVFYDRYHPDMARSLEGYGAHMHKYPLFNYDPFVAAGGPFMRSDFFSERQFRNLDIYADAFKIAGLAEHAAVPIPTKENALIFVGLERTKGRAFTDEDRTALTLLQPHLANARAAAVAATKTDPDQVRASDFCHTGLSPRQADVLYWMTRGKTNIEIAQILQLRPQTIKGHVCQIFDKLGVDNRHAAILLALEMSSITPLPSIKRRSQTVRACRSPAHESVERE